MTAPLSLPSHPSAPRPVRISWAAFLTPIVMAGALWLMTRSPYALAFAALGPAGAVVSLIDGRRGGGRDRRAALAERAAELDRLRGRIETAHDAERRELAHRAPGAGAWLDRLDGPALWKSAGSPIVTLGVGSVRSALRLDGDPRGADELELQRAAERLERAPVVVAPADGVAVCGPPLLARAYLRGLLVQLYAAFPPGTLAPPELIDAAGHAVGEWDWLDRLPHAVGAADGVIPRFGVFAEPRQVPPGVCAVVTVASPEVASVELYGPAVADRLAAPGRGEPLEASVRPELVARVDVESFVAALAARAAGLGLGAAACVLPAAVALSDLPAAGGPRLVASIGRSLSGVASVDLVADGPHAIVAGVTGSGKSELLVTWVAAMVSGRTPDEVVVLLVDFKGGTAFRPLAALAHTVGVITDLEHGEAARALSSLSAELRRREAELARLGVRDVADTGGELPRLVIVVDEFAAMIDAFPDFGTLFTDIAARGRALGIHLILATQRPAGVMRDALVANCPLRVSLRVQSEADSRWVIGTDAASRLSSATPGRAVLVVDGVRTEVQIAHTTAGDLADLAAASAGGPPPRRPWLDPLPAVLTRTALPAGCGSDVVGVADLPERQRRGLLRFDPAQAPLLVTGTARSGKSSVLRLFAAASGLESVVIGADPEPAWDAVAAAAERCDDPEPDGRGLLLAVDDADAVCARLGEDYAAVWCERLARVLRDGPAARLHTVVAAQRVAGPLRGALTLARETVLLRQPSKQEHVLAGAPAELFDDALPAGGGVWRGHRVQFLAPDADRAASVDRTVAGEPPAHVPLVPRPGRATVVVTRAPGRVAARARAAGLSPAAVVELGRLAASGSVSPEALLADPALTTGVLLVGDPDSWLARWALLTTLRMRHPIVFSGCDPSDVRAITRSRALPPPLAPGSSTGWLLKPDGTVGRCVLAA